MITDSQRMVDRSWDRVMPTARSSPSSRVRSKIDSASVFAMPSSAMRIARPEQRVHQGQHLVERSSTACGLQPGWSMHLDARVGRGDRRTAAVGLRPSSTPGAVLT